MSRKYVSAPIVEAVCEFKFSKDTPWDLTIPGMMYQKFSVDYPDKTSRILQEINLTGMPTKSPQKVTSAHERVMFSATDTKSNIQIGSHVLAVSFYKPYPHWEVARVKIKDAYKALEQCTDIKGFERIGLRYINRINVPLEGSNFNVEKYFQFKPDVGADLQGNFAGFNMLAIWAYHNGRDMCKVRLNTASPDSPGHISFILDIDYNLENPKDTKPDDALEWLEIGHTVVNSTFEGCIKDDLRELFDKRD